MEKTINGNEERMEQKLKNNKLIFNTFLLNKT